MGELGIMNTRACYVTYAFDTDEEYKRIENCCEDHIGMWVPGDPQFAAYEESFFQGDVGSVFLDRDLVFVEIRGLYGT